MEFTKPQIISEHFMRGNSDYIPRVRQQYEISDLQIGARGRLRVRVLSSEHAHFENFRPPNLDRVLSTENSYS